MGHHAAFSPAGAVLKLVTASMFTPVGDFFCKALINFEK